MNNEVYKHMADLHKRMKEFNKGYFVIIKLKLERLNPFKIIKKIGPNAYRTTTRLWH